MSGKSNRKCNYFLWLYNSIILFPADNFLDVVEFVKGFEGGEVVDIKAGRVSKANETRNPPAMRVRGGG